MLTRDLFAMLTLISFCTSL